MNARGWQTSHVVGDAGEFHNRAMPDALTPTVWWFEVDRPAFVLGSSQPIAQLDLDACARHGVDVVRRRSGGGGVLLEPGDALWVDVLIPPSDHRWRDDVSLSLQWIGDAWLHALSQLGVDGGSMHCGAMQRTTWSGHVCFAGVGSGEIVRGGRKIVGISQRRSREGARFQCALYRHWRADHHARLFADPAPTAGELADLAVEIDAAPGDVHAAFAAALTATDAAG